MNRPKDEADAQAAIAELDQLLETAGLRMAKGDHGQTVIWKINNNIANAGVTPKLALAMLIRGLRK